MHLHIGGMSRKKPLELFMNNSIFGGNPNEKDLRSLKVEDILIMKLSCLRVPQVHLKGLIQQTAEPTLRISEPRGLGPQHLPF